LGLSWPLASLSDYLFKIIFIFMYRWWKAYQEAQQFRFSHYFACYLSEACILLAGYGTIASSKSKPNKILEDKKIKKKNDKGDDADAKDKKLEKSLDLLW